MQQQLPKLKKRKLKDLRRLITFKLTQQKTKSYRRIRTALDQIEAGVNVDSDATTEEKKRLRML